MYTYPSFDMLAEIEEKIRKVERFVLTDCIASKRERMQKKNIH